MIWSVETFRSRILSTVFFPWFENVRLSWKRGLLRLLHSTSNYFVIFYIFCKINPARQVRFFRNFKRYLTERIFLIFLKSNSIGRFWFIVFHFLAQIFISRFRFFPLFFFLISLFWPEKNNKKWLQLLTRS